MSRRYLALSLPSLPVDRLRRQHPGWAGRPVAVWASIGNRRCLFATDAPGLHPGRALADAQAIRPDAVFAEADAEADAALLERLALWALRFTPLAAVDGADSLLLDTTGVENLFGGEESLLATVLESFRVGGYRAQGAIAGTPGCAAALARSAPRPLVLPSGDEPAALIPLPLTALRLPPEMVQGRPGWGCSGSATCCASHAGRWRAALAAPCWTPSTTPWAQGRAPSSRCGHRRSLWPAAICSNPLSPARPSIGCWKRCWRRCAGRWSRPVRAPAAWCCGGSGSTGWCRKWRSAPVPPHTLPGIWPGCSPKCWASWNRIWASSAWCWRPPRRSRSAAPRLC
ncbi:Y-family DNA polymerase [Teichococcus aestuarii]|uniref:Y-family DNA polymerase n=1 Tax=Teichococcus aestuarii TaxID=568898 RepID=UPI003618EC89